MKKMIIYIIIGIVALIAVSLGTWLFQKYNNTGEEIERANKIVISSKNGMQIGFIEVKDRKLNFVINNGNDDLKKYFFSL